MVLLYRSSNVRNFRNSIHIQSISRKGVWMHRFTRSCYIRLLYSIDSLYFSILDSIFTDLKRRYTIYNFLSNFLSFSQSRNIDSFAFREFEPERIDTKRNWSSWKRGDPRKFDSTDGTGMLRSSPPCPWARWRWVPAVSRPVVPPRLAGFARPPPRTRRKWWPRTRTKPRPCFSPPTCRNRGCGVFGVWNPCNASSCISCSPRNPWSWPAATGRSPHPVSRSATSSRYRRSWTWKKERRDCFWFVLPPSLLETREFESRPTLSRLIN